MIDSSPESSFREHDDVFLQTQTRIWLGELLNMRLDEDLPLSDLLQDGEILFEVSKRVWDLLLTKCMDLRHLKHKYGPFGSKMSSGRYRPYSNVDSFLKICKILGLSGIDLFSPSDIVEKRDIRKVCICIRALSKKTRSKQLSVPDFDMVRHSVSMPTDMVGIIRKTLESSQFTFSSSSSYGSHKSSQLKLKQNNLHAPSNQDDDSSSSDESDEAESSYMGENSFSSGGKLEYADGINSDLGHDRKQNVGENNYISDYLAFSDLMVHTTDGKNSVPVDGETNMFDFFLNVDSKKSTSDKRSFHNGSQRVYSDDEDTEVSSTTSMTSVLGRLLNLEFDNQFDEDDSSSTNVHPKEVQSDHFLESQEKSELSSIKSPKGESCDAESKSVVVANDNRASLCLEEMNIAKEDSRVAFNIQRNTSSDAENGSQDKTESVSDEKKDTSHQPARRKHNGRPLLKAVVKSTAIAGLLFILLQINKSKGNNTQERTRNAQISKSSSTKQQMRNGGNERYPTEKIKF